MQRFVNKTVLITGASAGVGAAAARQFAREGAHLALMARRAEPLEALGASLREQGTSVLTIPVDVRDEPVITQALEQVVATFGQLHVVVNSAGFNF